MVGPALLVLAAASMAQSGTCIAPTRVGSSEALTMRLRLTVQVRSAAGKPVQHVDVRFRDAAPPPQAHEEGLRIGSTDENGKLSTLVVHTWPDYFRTDRRPDVGTFDIIVATQTTHAAVECLPRDADEWRLAISIVADSETIIISQTSQQWGSRLTRR